MNYFNTLEVTEYSSDNSDLINLVTAVELLNKQNNTNLAYVASEYLGESESNSFDIFTNNMRVHGQPCGRDNYYRIKIHGSGWLEDISLKETLETILSKIEDDNNVDLEECLKQIKSNLIVKKKEHVSKEDITREVVDEAIRVFNIINSMAKYVEEYYEEYYAEYYGVYYNGKESAHIEGPFINILTTKSGDFKSIYLAACIEVEDCRFIISVKELIKNNNVFTYNLSVVNKGKECRTLKIEGVTRLIALINNIRYYGEKAFDMENCFEQIMLRNPLL